MQTVPGYRCNECGVSFGRVRELSEHRLIHKAVREKNIAARPKVSDDPAGINKRDRYIIDQVIEKLVAKVMRTPVRELQELIAGKKADPARAKLALTEFMLKALVE